MRAPIHRVSRLALSIFSSLPALALALCFVALISFAFELDITLWHHLVDFLLWRVFLNTLGLLVGVSLISLVLGIVFAYLVVFVDFPGRRYFNQLLALPLAMPAYVLAFVWIGLLDFSGPVQTYFREAFGFESSLFSIRNGAGAAFVLGLSLYPYIYFLAREAFLSQGQKVIEVAQSLGLKNRAVFFKVTLPFARPWILAGVSLVGLECLADFGVSMAFNYETWTVLTYRTWFDHFSLSTAAQLCLIQLSGIFVFLVLINRIRKKGSYVSLSNKLLVSRSTKHSARAWVISLLLGLFLFMLIGLPMLQLVLWSVSANSVGKTLHYFQNTLGLGVLAGCFVIMFSLLSSAVQRFATRAKLLTRLNQFALLGYAFPGTVMAISFIVGLSILLGSFSQSVWLSFIAMLFALVVRYFSVGFRSIESAYERIDSHLDEACQSLGQNKMGVFSKIHLPLLKPACFSAFFLVFMDTAKEMPIQVMMRPFGWDSLSTKIFQYTAEGQWEEASAPALALVSLSVLLGFLLKPSIDLSKRAWSLATNRKKYVIPKNQSTHS